MPQKANLASEKKNVILTKNHNAVSENYQKKTEKIIPEISKTELKPDTLIIVQPKQKFTKKIEDNIFNDKASFVNSIYNQSLTDEISKANKILFLQDTLQIVPQIKKDKIESSPFPPSVYVIPKDLIRREIK